MGEESIRYYNKKIRALGLSLSSKSKIKSKLDKYYKVFSKNCGRNKNYDLDKLQSMMMTRFKLSENEAKYLLILCKVKYLNDVTPANELIYGNRFATREEWGDYKIANSRTIKNKDIYFYVVDNFGTMRDINLKREIEEKFNVKLSHGWVAYTMDDYKKYFEE